MLIIFELIKSDRKSELRNYFCSDFIAKEVLVEYRAKENPVFTTILGLVSLYKLYYNYFCLFSRTLKYLSGQQ